MCQSSASGISGAAQVQGVNGRRGPGLACHLLCVDLGPLVVVGFLHSAFQLFCISRAEHVLTRTFTSVSEKSGAHEPDK